MSQLGNEIDFNITPKKIYIKSKHVKMITQCMHVWLHNICVRGLLEKYPTFGREKETGLLGALDT